MNRQDSPADANVFLFELIVSILFFAVAAGLCIQFFVQAHLCSLKAECLNGAVQDVSSVCELAASAEDPEALEALLQDFRSFQKLQKTDEETVLQTGYDEAFIPRNSTPVYWLTVTFRQDGDLLSGSAAVTDQKGQTVYALNFTHFTDAKNEEKEDAHE